MSKLAPQESTVLAAQLLNGPVTRGCYSFILGVIGAAIKPLCISDAAVLAFAAVHRTKKPAAQHVKSTI